MIETGIDIVEISRIRELIDTKGKLFINKIYTDKEIEYCENRKNNKYQSYAVRFAAKEAIFKAVSELLDDKFSLAWKDVEIINNENGKPKVIFLTNILEEKIESIDISISHCKEYAVASVVMMVKGG